MESSSKRRKIDHGDSGLRKTGLIDFESRNSTRLSTASTFVLQTDELLKEAKVDYTQASKGLFEQLQQLKEGIESIEPHDAVPIAEATSKLQKAHKIIVPYPSPKPEKDAPYKVAFEKPEKTNVVGSYVSQTMAKTQGRFGVDMVVQMPGTMFQDKDYTSMRYFYRRAYYIAYIAAHLRGQLSETMDIKYELLNENPLLPVLAVHPKSAGAQARNGTNNGKVAKKSKSKSPEFFIRIIPCCPEDLFPATKLGSSANCNRSKTEEADSKKGSQASTPFYNSTLKAESSFITYLRVLSAAKSSCAGFADACILGRIWLQQRGFGGAMSQGGFGHFEWAAMMALLLRSEGRNGHAGLSTSLSGPELFKAVIQFLSDNDFSKKPFIFGAASKADMEGIKEQGPVMYDPKTKLNLLHKMTSWSASLLQLHARSTTDLLADESAEKFDPIFIAKADVLSQVFDDVLTVRIPDLTKFSSVPDRKGAMWNFSSDLYKVLKKAYGGRAQLIHIQPPPAASWTTTSSLPGDSGHVLVGVVYEFAQMSRQMEHGPPAEEQKEAAKFRQLWGDRAELRRFKDGSILECVEWESKLPEDICQEITKWVLWRHFKIAQDDIIFHPQRSHSAIQFTPIDKEAFDKARRAFQTFENDVRNLEDLPLQVRQLSPTSPFTRYASVEPPMIGLQQGSAQQPIDVNMYFEASSRWPENLVAIQEAKIEFLLDLDKRLTAAHDNITTVLGRENRDIGMENLAYLDVIYDTGAAFRVRIHCDMEETLLERQVNNKTLEPRVREQAEEVLARFTWLFTTKPLHNQTIATFCTRLHSLSQTIRLMKQWFNKHKLAHHFSEELIELFVLHVFLKPYPWRIPQSASTGFYRTLHFLSRWNWRDEPLVVDSAEGLTHDDRSAIRRELEGWRKRDPNMNHTVMVVATSHDTSGLAYTRHSPSKLFAGRMTRLAKSALKILKEQDHLVDPATLFETSLQDYDILIHTSSKALRSLLRDTGSANTRRQPSHFKNLELAASKPSLPLRAPPLQVLLDELQRVYEDTLTFACGAAEDAEDDGVIGAIWNPRLQKQKFRAGLPYNVRRVDDDGDIVEVNKQAVLLEIARIGGDLFKKIEEVEEEEEE